MWIGTQAGLQRFDGTRFKTFLGDIHDSTALQSDWIGCIFEDSRGRLWIGNGNGGMNLFDKASNRFYNYNLHALEKNKLKAIWNIAEDKEGNIWVGEKTGFFKLNVATNQFEKYNDQLGLKKNLVTANIQIDEDDNIWMSTVEGVMCYNLKEKKLYGKAYNPDHEPIFEHNESVDNIIRDKNIVWVTYSRTICRYDLLTKKTKTFSFNKRNSTSKTVKELLGPVFFSVDKKVFVSLLGRGFAVYDEVADSFLITNVDNAKANGFHVNENIVSGVASLVDKEKNIWIGNESGINIFNPAKNVFHCYRTGPPGFFPRSEISNFLEDDNGDIFASFYNVNGGIVVMDSTMHFKKQYIYNNDKNSVFNQTWCLFKDAHNIMWAPNQMGGVLKIDLNSGKVREYEDPVLAGQVILIKQDGSNTLWLGHWNKGLAKIDIATQKKTTFTDFLYAKATERRSVYDFLLDGNKIWVATGQNGLQVFDKISERFVEAFNADTKNEHAISSNIVTDIIRYNKDTLLLATQMGVNVFDIKSKTFKAITTKEGLANNIALNIIKDSNGNVWVTGGSGGFSKINMKDLSVTNYDVNDGIIDNDFTSKFYPLKNGKILLGASGSFMVFDPLEITASLAPAAVTITGMHIFEKEILVDSFVNTPHALEISYKENSLQIAFASLEYWAPKNLKYYYKLEGVDKNWIPADKNNIAVYNQLKDGEYTFKVKCANRDGIFCIDTTQLKIIIRPPFWKTWWFIAIVLSVITLVIYSFIKWRIKNIKAIASEKLKVQQVNAEQYKSKLELEQIINYFSSSLVDKNTIDTVLWDVAKNLIGRLGFVDCMIYLWNSDKTKMIQKAGFGPKDSIEEITKQVFDVLPGQGVVGYVMQTKEPLVIADTSIDSRYRADDLVRLSEITVPLIYNNELVGVIDSEHHEKNFFTKRHLQALSTIATLVTNKIRSIEAEQSLHQKNIEMYTLSEQLSKAKLEALRSQMNPHFIFNSLNAIQECILTNKVDAAYEYLSKFSKLQRMVLNNSEKELIPLSNEIEMIQLYLSLESLRFSKSFTYNIDAASIADADEIMIPSLITQPFVENAIWHGLRNKEGNKTLKITYEEKEGLIIITIDDDGIGRAKAALIREQKIGSGQFASKGTILLEQRLHILSQQLMTEIKLALTDKKDEQGNAAGTLVTIVFPSNL